MTIPWKTIEQAFRSVLFVLGHNVALTILSVTQTVECNHTFFEKLMNSTAVPAACLLYFASRR